MELGFETIGNATLICHDNGPILTTDPWIKGSAYFGSWVTSHEIPAEQMANIKASRYLWISHGHPDHLSMESLEELRDKEILLPDHYGGRIAKDLRGQGYNVRILKDGVWTTLSERCKVLSIGDYTQDAILLVDLGGTLLVDANDAGDHGAGAFVRETAAKYERSVLLSLTGYGDADMINFFDEDGVRVPPPAMSHTPFLPTVEGILDAFGIHTYAPFSSQHKYQRTDSAWANACTTPIEAYEAGFSKESGKVMLPAFCRYDLKSGDYAPINPKPRPDDLHEPEEFGDNWEDELQPGELKKIAAYFHKFDHLKRFLGFINFRVGGKDNRIEISPEHKTGITFETPRQSLMTSIEYEIFDDLLIGNFTRTTLHGDWGGKEGTAALYPNFSPFVARFGDNGGSRNKEELRAYFAEYERRGFSSYFQHTGVPGVAEAQAPYRDE